jgi:squalene-associated FAD-dependent desaturase
MTIAVIGAGWAGLTAALTLREAGYNVTVLEASHTPGGRARRVNYDGFDEPLDNGQHILLGAYSETLTVMRSLGRDPNKLLMPWPLSLVSLDGTLQIKVPASATPWQAALALFGTRGLTWRDRFAVYRLLQTLQASHWRVPLGETVIGLLQRLKQPPAIAQLLWEPLCLAALNTPASQACAQLYTNVLRDSLGGPAPATTLLLPRVDLSALWPDAAAALLPIHYGYPVRTVVPQAEGVLINGDRYTAAVLAVPPRSLTRMLDPSVATRLTIDPQLSYSSFTATLTLRLTRPWRLPQPMVMLHENTAAHHYGQWLFDRAWLLGKRQDHHGEITVVVSAAQRLAPHNRHQIEQALITQIRTQASTNPQLPPMPPVERSLLLIDKNATFLAIPSLRRPPQVTAWPRLALAGDWTDTDYPAVLEGAVRSGRKAAAALIATVRA